MPRVETKISSDLAMNPAVRPSAAAASVDLLEEFSQTLQKVAQRVQQVSASDFEVPALSTASFAPVAESHNAPVPREHAETITERADEVIEARSETRADHSETEELTGDESTEHTVKGDDAARTERPVELKAEAVSAEESSQAAAALITQTAETEVAVEAETEASGKLPEAGENLADPALGLKVTKSLTEAKVEKSQVAQTESVETSDQDLRQKSLKPTEELVRTATEQPHASRNVAAQETRSISQPALESLFNTAAAGQPNFAVTAALIRQSVDLVKQAVRQNLNSADDTRTQVKALDGAVRVDSVAVRAQRTETLKDRIVRDLPRAQAQFTYERIEQTLKEVAKSRDGKTLSFRLDPPSLGSVKVDMTMRDGNLHARVVAESPAVQNLLRERAPELQQALRKLGLNVDEIRVSVGGDFQSAENGESFGQSPRGQESTEQDLNAQVFSERQAPLGNSSQAVLRADDTKNRRPLDHWVA
jgi:flagellar hook-length control protein FliK